MGTWWCHGAALECGSIAVLAGFLVPSAVNLTLQERRVQGVCGRGVGVRVGSNPGNGGRSGFATGGTSALEDIIDG